MLRARILVVDDDLDWRSTLASLLTGDGYAVTTAANADEALAALALAVYHVAIIDLRLQDSYDPRDVSGLELAGAISGFGRRLPLCIVLTGYGTFDTVRSALRDYHAANMVSKTEPIVALLEAVADATTQALEIDTSFSLQSTWQAFEEVEFGTPDTQLEHIARALFHGVADVLQLQTLPNTFVRSGHVLGCMLDTGSVFSGSGVPGLIPLLLLQLSGLLDEDLRAARSVMLQIGSGRAHAALMLVSDRTADSGAFSTAAREDYGLDLVPVRYTDLAQVAVAQDPNAALRDLVVSRISLRSLSPFTTTSPVTHSMFFGREPVLRRIVEQTKSSFAVTGGRRIGKTSLLKQLHTVRLPAGGSQSLYADCSTLTAHNRDDVRLLFDWQPPAGSGMPDSFAGLIAALPLNKNVPLVLLLDEADRLVTIDAAAGWPWLWTLRAAANAGHLRFILSGERKLREALRDAGSPLFNAAEEIRMGPLDYRAVAALVVQPMRKLAIRFVDEHAVVDRIYAFTSGHPNIVQRLCQLVIESLNETSSRQVTVETVDAILTDIRFQEEDFLSTYWERATTLEKIISLLLSEQQGPYRLQVVLDVLSAQRIQADAGAVKTALDGLVYLRSILKLTPKGYEFAAAAFPLVVANTTSASDLLLVLKSQYARDLAGPTE